MEQLLSNINYWIQTIREYGEIADISDALKEFKDSIQKAGFTENEVYIAWLNQN